MIWYACRGRHYVSSRMAKGFGIKLAINVRGWGGVSTELPLLIMSRWLININVNIKTDKYVNVKSL